MAPIVYTNRPRKTNTAAEIYRRTARETTTPGPAVDGFSRQRFRRRYCKLRPRAHRWWRACVQCLLTTTYYRVTSGARVYNINPGLLWRRLMCGVVYASSVNRRKSYSSLSFVFIKFFSSFQTFHCRIPEYDITSLHYNIRAILYHEKWLITYLFV